MRDLQVYIFKILRLMLMAESAVTLLQAAPSNNPGRNASERENIIPFLRKGDVSIRPIRHISVSCRLLQNPVRHNTFLISP